MSYYPVPEAFFFRYRVEEYRDGAMLQKKKKKLRKRFSMYYKLRKCFMVGEKSHYTSTPIIRFSERNYFNYIINLGSSEFKLAVSNLSFLY